MTHEQVLAFALIGAVVGMLIWDRLRYDIVALLGLIVGVVVGLIPAEAAFSGFSDDIVIIVGSALVVSAGVARSGVADTLIGPLAPWLNTPVRQIAVLGGTVALLSAVMKNIGALAILMPVAMQLARRHKTSAHFVLMPMSFCALVGGLITLIGTTPNIVVSRIRAEMTGERFGMFDYAPVGASLTAAALLFLVIGWRLLPRARVGARSAEETFAVETYASEMRLPPGSSYVGRTVGELEKLAGGEAMVIGIIRERFRRYAPDLHWTLLADDVLVLQGDAPALQRLVRGARLEPLGTPENQRATDTVIVEAVIGRDSPLIGRSALNLDLRHRIDLSLLAISRRGEPVEQRLRRVMFGEGDLLLLELPAARFPDALSEVGILPLAERRLQLGRRRPLWLPIAIVAATMGLAVSHLLPLATAFLAGAVAMVVTGVLKPEEAYEAVEWPILVLFAALIPVSDTLRATGGTEVIARALADLASALPPTACVGLIMAAAMAVTPFLNNAATVLVMAPIGASLATQLHLSPDPFLMAVAVGAGSDFLTPIGHQCNTLVMGPGGYKFSDYPRLGAPLSLIILVIGTLLIAQIWPLTPWASKPPPRRSSE
jgi:di/tricarboxylate transporter